jgi:hypothetical protein
MTIQVRYQDGEIRAGFCIKQAALLFARKEPGIDKVSDLLGLQAETSNMLRLLVYNVLISVFTKVLYGANKLIQQLARASAHGENMEKC